MPAEEEVAKEAETGENYAHLAYQVEKYKDGKDPGVEFCTDGSNIENIDSYIIGKRIG